MEAENKKMFGYILFGFGIGVVFASIINLYNPVIKYKDYSEQEIINKAHELGMIKLKDKLENNIDVEQSTKENRGNDDINNDNYIKNNDELDNAIDIDDEVENDNETKSNDQKINQEDKLQLKDNKIVKLTIKKGESSETISRHLYELGIIDDKVKFNNYIIKNGLDKRFLYGTFELNPKMDYDSVVSKITIEK